MPLCPMVTFTVVQTTNYQIFRVKTIQNYQLKIKNYLFIAYQREFGVRNSELGVMFFLMKE